MRRPSYLRLEEALDAAAEARACISQNRGPDRVDARESYERLVSEELVPAMERALGELLGDVSALEVERIGRSLLRAVCKHEGRT